MPDHRRPQSRPWLLIAAYDISQGESSEGYVAFNVLQRLSRHYRVLLITRRNNQQRLLAQPNFRVACPGVRVLGFDLPRWASWWKRGARFYGLYAYMWQLIWPVVLRRRIHACKGIKLVHVLNFHNDSIPPLAWILGRPMVWGPVNHNELIPAWRRKFWPIVPTIKHPVVFSLRCLAWRLDPLLWLGKHMTDVILSAGPWVDRRLRLDGLEKVIRLNQLGVDATHFSMLKQETHRHQDIDGKLLVAAGRLDWPKGVDVAIEALAELPEDFRLLVIGKGPAGMKLQHLVNQMGLAARVEFQPPTARWELARIYAGAHLFLFPSCEVAGLAWVEALACGLPVVGFAGNTELGLSDGTLPGVFLAPSVNNRAENIHQYAAAIAHAVDRQHDHKTISASALARYDWDRMADVIQSSYSQALEGPR